MINMKCLVMAGGMGTRFWPESTSKKPKQYLSLVSENSLLRDTLNRFEGLVDVRDRYVVTVKEQEGLAREHAGDMILDNGLIFEPAGRNTAPCILLSLAHLLHHGASLDDVVAIVPADHVILNESGFRKTIQTAAELAVKEDKIVTIGIKPNFPHTGFGYIEKGEEIEDNIYNVHSFKEKPDLETAKSYVASGNYFWNAGMFMGSIKVLLNEFKQHSPDIFRSFKELKNHANDFKKISELYQKIPSDSIDYAIMEKSKNIATCVADFDWNDLGSWDALESVLGKVEDNTIVSLKEHYFEEASGNIVFAPGKFVSLINVSDLIVVSNEKSVIVMPKADSQKVKNIVNYLKSKKSLSELL